MDGLVIDPRLRSLSGRVAGYFGIPAHDAWVAVFDAWSGVNESTRRFGVFLPSTRGGTPERTELVIAGFEGIMNPIRGES